MHREDIELAKIIQTKDSELKIPHTVVVLLFETRRTGIPRLGTCTHWQSKVYGSETAVFELSLRFSLRFLSLEGVAISIQKNKPYPEHTRVKITDPSPGS